MDFSTLIKILHGIVAVTIFFLLLLRAYPVLIQRVWRQESSTSNKIIVGLQHLGYSLLVFSGLWLASLSSFDAQPWFYAKIILFFVILSASIKAFNRKKDIPLTQRQFGLSITIIAFCALFALVFFKPQFG